MRTPISAGVSLLFAAISGLAIWQQEPASRTAPTEALARAATTLLEALPSELRQRAVVPFGDAERLQWNFVPGRYAGVELGALDAGQRAKAHDVLRTMLGLHGYAKAMSIVALENVLHDLESRGGADASHRDPDRYSLLFCGEPAALGTYTVRFQGHHVSLQVAVRDGRVAGLTPQFLGSNPHEVPGPAASRRRVFGAEEDLARAFLLLLDDEQLARAVIATEAPPDVLLGPGKPPAALGERRGLPWSAMNETQRGVLWRLLEEYASVQRPEHAAAELARIRAQDLDQLSFAWAGGRERGQGHYYRIHGVHFVVEYDCTQNDANHVHTVWRDFDRDFGGDPLREHLEHQHGPK